MKHLKIFEEFVEKSRNTAKVYEDENLVVKVVKTLDSSRAISDPQWCSTSKHGFYKHNLTANMYRFIFKDGYMLRLTWDYFPQNQYDFSSGTHWGQGGVKDGESAPYTYIRPVDDTNPFYFDYDKNDYRQYMVDRIKQIPQAAIDSISKYQESHKQEKMALFQNMYREIEKIRVVGVRPTEDEFYKDFYDIQIVYRDKSYTITSNFGGYFKLGNFKKDFKNKYALVNSRPLDNYISDKAKEWMKKHNKR